MFNQFPYNHQLYVGNNLGYGLTSFPAYNRSVIAAVARVHRGFQQPRFVVGGMSEDNGGSYGLFSRVFIDPSTGDDRDLVYSFSMWRSTRYVIGQQFNIKSITLPLSDRVDGDTMIVPILDFDNSSVRVAGNVIDALHYQEDEDRVVLTSDNFGNNVQGKNNFALELHFRGTVVHSVVMPITIDLETEDIA